MNKTGVSTQIYPSGSKFNPNTSSPAYNGYMYGTPYTVYTRKISSNTTSISGNSFIYDETTKEYTLQNTASHLDVNQYTCFNESGVCKRIFYIYKMTSDSFAYYYGFSNGLGVEGIEENKNDSDIKKAVDGWYEKNLLDYTPYLEDTVWCNDRSVEEEKWRLESSILRGEYLSYERTFKNHKPSLTCQNRNDAFTVSEEFGNGDLKYPIGLLTSDEVMLAGGHGTNITSQMQKNYFFYLYSGTNWWLLTPYEFTSSPASSNAYGMYVKNDGSIWTGYLNYSQAGIRPSIALSSKLEYRGGNGTSENPYTLFLE